MLRTFLLYLAVASAPLWSQTGQAFLSGHAVNTLTGDPIPGVKVHLLVLTGSRHGEGPMAESQADGSFRFDSLDAGTYVMIPEKEGFTASLTPKHFAMLTLAPGASISDAEVELIPDGGVSGKVTDENGAGIPGVRLEALYVPGGGRRRWLKTAKQTATSDKNGRFQLSQLGPGSYFLLACPDPKAFRARADGYKPVDTFYPEGESLAEAAPILVAAGQQSSADVKLRFGLTYHIQGKVTELPPGIKAAALRLEVGFPDLMDVDSLTRSTKLNPDLTFSLEGLVPGMYEVLLRNQDSRRLVASDRVEIGSTDVTGLVLRPSPRIALTGMVTVEGSTSVALTSINVFALELEYEAPGGAISSPVAADGTFALGNLDPGSYLITVSLRQPGLYVSALTLNKRDILNKAVNLAEVPGGQLEATLRTAVGQISGTVSESPSMVILVPNLLAPDASNVRITYTQKHTARFVLPNLAPGDYQLFASAHFSPSAWTTPAFLDAIRNLGQAVHLEEGASQTVQLTPVSEALLRDQALRLGLNF